MKLRTLILASLFGLSLSPVVASADELSDLSQQIKALTQRVEALEKKLGQVSDTQSTIVAATPLPSSDPWQQLKIGMTTGKVEELLGDPLSKHRGSVEMWYYSEAKKEGPFVKFIFKQVHSWREPQTEEPTPAPH